MNAIESLYVPALPPALKHPTIFNLFDRALPGEAFVIINDHDPKPLYYQLLAEKGNIFSWKYLQEGPEEWQVQIAKKPAAGSETVGQLAAADLRKAEVFRKYGIDFCCGGKKSLKQACADARVSETEVQAALDSAVQAAATPTFDFNRWSADFLADYIYNQHHEYYYEHGPVIADLCDKVTGRHGNHFPQLYELSNLYRQLQQELDVHFQKEEKVLFPFIKALVAAHKTGDGSGLLAYPSVQGPVHAMEADHDDAGEVLAQIKALTDNYTPPAGSCNSFRFLYKKLQDLEEDLHLHIHLENNILFPKALALEADLRQGSKPGVFH
ncbi:iron-sulfur cluster repair di-iron protein [Paraflavisolibacter sp. H34]|uniref:iron-sulfur cluster repair di-iron protein n=1 Tax=Huijunlia imazamoxiresistens TaxID=3127457 RepID=UPI003015EA7B